MGVACEALGDYEGAMSYYEERLRIAKEIKDRRSQDQARASLKTACYAIGDYARVVKYD